MGGRGSRGVGGDSSLFVRAGPNRNSHFGCEIRKGVSAFDILSLLTTNLDLCGLKTLNFGIYS